MTEVAEVPCPAAREGQLLIRTTRSLISAGTERMLLEFGRASLLDKARQQPERVKMVLDKVRTDGLKPTVDAVRNKLNQPLAMGYCNVGVVAEIGVGVTGFAIGDRVASNGKHAEMVSVPVNLCAHIPDSVDDDDAAFAVIGAIALQGIRLVEPTLGEAVVVTGLGLIGLLTVQLLRAQGCRVLGIDIDPARLELARNYGAETANVSADETPMIAAERFSRDRGVDAVIVTAATKSSEPVHQAALMCRKRGRIVLVGVTGLELSRDDFYQKELSFQVSCSYGPGRYDPSYEEGGRDYPIGFVRWTEQRNFEAVLDMMADGRLNMKSLISHRFALEAAERAYAVVGGAEPSLGILLEYQAVDQPSSNALLARSVSLLRARPDSLDGAPAVGFIGSGNYATAVLIPAFKAAGARLVSVASSTGVSGLKAGRKFGFEETTTDTASLFTNKSVETLIIATRHDSHGPFVVNALAAGKNVFVEKPLCLTIDELSRIEAAYSDASAASASPLLMVGFNRRFAPHVQRMKSLLASTTGPKAFVMTVNAGAIPLNHWAQDPAVGGGRIIGEACHFIDLFRFLAGSPIVSRQQLRMHGAQRDTVSLQLGFADGSIGTVHYFANGSKALSKERLEVFTEGRVLQLDNFRKLKGFGWPGFTQMNLWQQDKGQRACAAAFLEAVRGSGRSPISFDEIVEVTRVTIQLARMS